MIGQYLKIWNLREQTIQNIEKSPLKLFKLSSSFDIFTVGNLQNILMEHDLYLIC